MRSIERGFHPFIQRASPTRMQNRQKKILVVGAGFAGATHARILAESGIQVDVVERRDHVAGNAHDAVDMNGIRVHRYGPHLFHTNAEHVFAWLSRFGNWVPYRHRVRALLWHDTFAPLPINLDTINMVFDKSLKNAAEVEAFLASTATPIEQPRNAAEYLRANIGDRLTDLFFRPYTRKMWRMELEELDIAVVRRIPIRFDKCDEYFPGDKIQTLPEEGYTALVERILDHELIRVSLCTPFTPGMERDYRFCFNSMPIDEYFDCSLGALPYRSIRFHHTTMTEWDERDWSVTNYTDDRLFSRESWWHCLPHHLSNETGRRTVTREEPCDYTENNFERYYPVKTADGRWQDLYQRYKALSKEIPNMAFIGRCGTYQYLDMDQVINQSLASARRWLQNQ
jgi:UDP-galactopyranose mutase